MRSTCLGVVAVLTLGCLETPPPRRAPTAPALLRVESATGDLLGLGRVPSLRLRFDRPMRPPLPDDLVLLRGAASPSASSDLERLPLSSSTAARRIDARVVVEPSSPDVFRVESLTALPPDTELALLLSTRLRAVDGATLEAPTQEALRVASITRCGALATLSVPTAVASAPGALPLRFDRGVRGPAPALGLYDARGVALPSVSRLDCLDEDGFARCAWITPAAPLPVGRYALRVGALRARNEVGCEAAPLDFEVSDEPQGAPLDFARPLPCAADERAFAGVCARISPSEVTLRAATHTPSVLRARVVPDDQGDPREAVSPSGTSHTLRVAGLRPLTRHALTLWALDGRGEPVYLPLGAVDTPAAQGDLRITEVLPRPRGSSAQEFVEIENRGAEPVALRGWSFESGGGSASLETDAVLAPGARALIAGAAFDVRGSVRSGDPVTAPGATVVLMRGSVAGRGLRDDGADLTLLSPSGLSVSTFPGDDPALAPRAGVSLVRAAWDLDEDDPHAWSYDRQGGSTPGSPNRAD